MTAYTTVIFDLDGTLLDTLADLADGVNIALAAYHMPPKTIEEVRLAVGNGVVRLMEKMVPDGKDNELFEACLDTFRTEYAKISRNKTKPYDGIPALLDTLAAKGYHLAVVSNKFHDAVVDLVKSYFPQIPHAAGERESCGIRKKPAPDTVFAMMREIGVPAEECVYVGDSEVDVLTAKNAGIDCISVTWGFREKDVLLESGASVFADTMDELLAAIGHGKDRA
ncbi:MAG: HAD-IIIA family hydrolase [Ruminococcaceae bacterium]|nr:HAD-IIIA family hydrolase [Oscillospiraceae bacterium]